MKYKLIVLFTLGCCSGYFIHLFAQNNASSLVEAIFQMEKIIAIEFTSKERALMLGNVRKNRQRFRVMRKSSIPNHIPPSLQFVATPVKSNFSQKQLPVIFDLPKTELPKNLGDLAFYSVAQLSQLLRSKRVTSLQLTKLFLQRLKKFDGKLKCVISYTEKLAWEQAKQADQEIMAGKYRSPLHGIPYGVKDLLAVKGYKTTWGAKPYKDQELNTTATVVKKLEKAGAVLVAKLSLGALAWGDVWFGGKTRNPWDLNQGSSGSSAGSACAVSAGLLPFAIGSETWGSIVSPCTRCGVTGLRPSFGRVSRLGAMALSWSMDKLGPICRSAEDCAIVFNTIYGPDGLDQSVVDLPFNYNARKKLSELRIGYLVGTFHNNFHSKNNLAVLEVLQKAGAKLIPFKIPTYPVDAISLILQVEAAAVFDELTRSDRDNLLVRQVKHAWPNVFRFSRLIPAVEYLQANRIRYVLIQNMAEKMRNIDVYIAPSFANNNLLLTNLTGHPCVVVPNGFDKNDHPTSISFIGSLYNEADALLVAKVFQQNTDFHLQHPPLFK